MNTTVAKRINFQNEYKTKHNDDSIMLFRDMDFYFMYNEDADRVSEATGISKAHADQNEFTYTAFSARKLDQYLPVLIRKGYRVAISDGDMCSTNGGRVNPPTLQIITPKSIRNYDNQVYQRNERPATY